MRKTTAVFLFIFFFGFAWGASLSVEQHKDEPVAVWRYTAEEIKLEAGNEDARFFPHPAAIDFDRESLYVLDMTDSQIRVFSKSGEYRYSIGRRGQGPAEFHLPVDMDVLEDRIYVADSQNRRIQVVDKEGSFLGGFRVMRRAWKILVLDPDSILISHIPGEFRKSEKMLHSYDAEGKLRWETFDSSFTGNRVYDSLANLFFLERAEKSGFYLLKMHNDDSIHHFDSKGNLLKKIKVDERYSIKTISIPLGDGQRKQLRSFCEHAVFHDGKFYLLMSEFSKDEKDLVPGKQIAIMNPEGKLIGFIDLPERIWKFRVEGQMLYAIDTDNTLRIFRLEREREKKNE